MKQSKEIIEQIRSTDGVHSKAELILFIENMTQEEFEAFCDGISVDNASK